MIQNLKYFVYNLRGKIPWSRGYIASRTRFIKESLSSTVLNMSNLPSKFGFSFDERAVEYLWFFSRLSNEKGKLLDAGSVLNFDYILEHPKLKNKKLSISTLVPEDHCFWNHGISYVYEDLRNSCFKDHEFDEIVSLSTLEHVGFDNSVYTQGIAAENQSGTYIEAVLELKRMLKPGGKLYLSVPYGKWTNHGWFQILNAPMIDALVEKFQPSKFQEWIFKYDREKGWTNSNREETKNCLYFEKNSNQDLMGLEPQNRNSSSMVAAAEAVLCLELTRD